MIRRAVAADLPRLVALAQLMHAESRFRIFRFSERKTHNLFQGLIDSPDTALVLVAVDDETGEIFGALALLFTEQVFSEDCFVPDVGLFVDPAHRGGMAAARLVAEGERWARERGALTYELGINTGVAVERTARLFERRGLERTALLYVKEL